MSSTESIPQAWDDARDDAFFRMTVRLFSPSYCCGASALLASYDPDDAFTTTTTASAPARTGPATAAHAGRTRPAESTTTAAGRSERHSSTPTPNPK
jgi:hypothetical protein